MAKPLLQLIGLTKHFGVRAKGGRAVVHAVDDLSLDIHEGETLGLVGESGCGKSTTAHMIVGLAEPTRGDVIFNGRNVAGFVGQARRQLRQQLQYIFQDPNDSLDPRMKVRSIVSEGLRAQGRISRREVEERAAGVLRQVGLPADAMDRFPHEFSGGQRQRIGIARALIMQPRLVVADEPISALDVSVQSQILNLMGDLKRELGLTYVFVSHNLAAVGYISDRIAVMYLDRIVEIGRTGDIMTRPRHPYTEALLSAIPEPDRQAAKRTRVALSGDVPSPIDPPSGCHFHTRCPFAQPRCAAETPVLEHKAEDGADSVHLTACHFPSRHAQSEICR